MTSAMVLSRFAVRASRDLCRDLTDVLPEPAVTACVGIRSLTVTGRSCTWRSSPRVTGPGGVAAYCGRGPASGDNEQAGLRRGSHRG